MISTFTACAEENPSDPRDIFVGNYEMSQTCDGQANPGYTMVVSKSSQNANEIILQNLGSYGQSVRASVAGNEITIPSQQVGAGLIGMVTVSGTGTLDTSNNTIEILMEVIVPTSGGGQSTSTCLLEGEKV